MKKLQEKLQQHCLNEKDQLMIKGGRLRTKVVKVQGQGIPPIVDLKW